MNKAAVFLVSSGRKMKLYFVYSVSFLFYRSDKKIIPVGDVNGMKIKQE